MAAEEFDFVVAGAGSAGCVLATRLSEDPSVRVCLLEAGPKDKNPLIHIPMGVIGLINGKAANWRYQSAPQGAANGRSIYLPQGKVLGGGSSINGMVYMRGHPRDYDDWAEAGNPGWSYRDVLPYFRRSENNAVWRNSPHHGTEGPLSVRNFTATNEVSEAFIQSGEMLQLGRNADFNGGDPSGFGYRQVTQKNGQRHSTAQAYLKLALKRPNLTVITGAMVDRVVFDGKRARGIAFLQDGQRRSVTARREVVLSGGAVGSPAFLMRSGIGDAATLAGLGIDVVHHSPWVGGNLQDHVTVPLMFRTKNTAPYGISLRSLPRLAWAGIEYALFRRGLLASNGLEAAAFIRTDPSLERPDIQYSCVVGFRGKFGSIGLGHGFGAFIVLMRPKSRGTVGIATADPMVPPVIDPNYLSDEDDLRRLLAGFRTVRRVFAAPPMAVYQGEEVMPGADMKDDEALLAWFRENSGTAFHLAGSARMGPDADSVVDAELRVRGVDGLRVVDCSVMPTVIGGNTNAPAIMMGEKIADSLLGKSRLAPADLPG